MSAVTGNVTLETGDLNPTDRAILDELRNGRCTPAFVAEKHSYSSGNVRNRMTHLASHDHVEGIGGGLYQLVDDPCDDTEPDPSHSEEYVQELEARNRDLEREVDRLREQSGTTVDTDSVCDDLKRALENREWGAVEDAASRLGCEFHN